MSRECSQDGEDENMSWEWSLWYDGDAKKINEATENVTRYARRLGVVLTHTLVEVPTRMELSREHGAKSFLLSLHLRAGTVSPEPSRRIMFQPLAPMGTKMLDVEELQTVIAGELLKLIRNSLSIVALQMGETMSANPAPGMF